MKCRIKKIKGINTYHLNFDKQTDMTLSLLRLQEYYESPEFASKRFTMEEYIEWYVEKFHEFNYLTETGGMNIPGRQVKEFFRRFNDLSKKEHDIYNLLVENDILCLRRFYIIATYGTSKDSKNYLSHEIRHAMFHLNDSYRKRVLEAVAANPVDSFRKKLIKFGYGEHVVDDEIHCYAMTGMDPFYNCPIKDLPKDIQKLRRALKVIEKDYFDKEGNVL
jgi:hypothetical protein